MMATPNRCRNSVHELPPEVSTAVVQHVVPLKVWNVAAGDVAAKPDAREGRPFLVRPLDACLRRARANHVWVQRRWGGASPMLSPAVPEVADLSSVRHLCERCGDSLAQIQLQCCIGLGCVRLPLVSSKRATRRFKRCCRCLQFGLQHAQARRHRRTDAQMQRCTDAQAQAQTYRHTRRYTRIYTQTHCRQC